MALDKDLLGQDLYDVRNLFDNKNYDALVQEYGSIEAARLALCKKEAEAIINHFISNIKLNVPGAGLIDPQGGTIGGTSITGTIE